MLQRWLGTVRLSCEGRFKRVQGYAEIPQVIVTIKVEHAEPHAAPTKTAA